ncbi:hypothetical protein EGI22_06320 [Lacihabitans sp. LS3-19]|uniref:hypothetical protein n=1 Tax=Lacihabitans sp. LS3-19 TaxID=2487335 RepID=UPI0020CEB561|nr:hypothetical protein [Lacihabitans sp. LS3-19]MCP9767519.1 hypothetical protein [Lacihabitans sp. LS3-19]
MKKLILFILIAQATLISCGSDEGNEKLGQASEKVGKSAATVVKSVKEGIEKVAKIKIDVSESLKAKGISTGKVTLNSKNGRHNLLNVYMIFDKNINRNITLKVYDNEGLEIGRSKTLVKGEAGDAKYFDFLFDGRTNIDRDHKIVME